MLWTRHLFLAVVVGAARCAASPATDAANRARNAYFADDDDLEKRQDDPVSSAEPVPSSSQAPAATGTPDNSPPPNEFLRRTHGRVAVMGNRIYYEGGEISQVGYNGWRHSNPLNTTLSIDLSTSWFPADVSIRETRRPDSPAMLTQALLIDEKSESFYAWGGMPAWFAAVPNPPKLWRFSGKENSWDEAEPASVSTFEGLERTEYAAFASAPAAGFVFGGRLTDRSEGEGTPHSNPSQYLSFDFESKEWERHRDPPYSVDGSLWGGQALFVPDFGPNGLIFILGGMRGRDETEPTYISFEQLHFMDPVTGKWYSQTANGGDSVPRGRHQHCVVGASGSDGTYDIFMFGGASDTSVSGFPGIHVLSLPSFTWTLAHVPPAGHAREGHACAVVGKSQLLSWGGLSYPAASESYGEADTFPQGLGIFDLNRLSWNTEYDPNADSYKAHDRVVSARATSVSWSSPEVSALFAKSNNGGDETDGNNPSEPSPSGEAPKESATPVGAIAGGVVGGVAFLAAVTSAVWFFCLRKRKESGAAEVEGASQQPKINPDYMRVAGGPGSHYASELHGQSPPAEMMISNHQHTPAMAHEMDGNYYQRNY